MYHTSLKCTKGDSDKVYHIYSNEGSIISYYGRTTSAIVSLQTSTIPYTPQALKRLITSKTAKGYNLITENIKLTEWHNAKYKPESDHKPLETVDLSPKNWTLDENL